MEKLPYFMFYNNNLPTSIELTNTFRVYGIAKNHMFYAFIPSEHVC